MNPMPLEEKGKRMFTTDLIKGQTEYYLSQEMSNITKITVNGKSIGFDIVFRLLKVPIKSEYNAIKVFINQSKLLKGGD